MLLMMTTRTMIVMIMRNYLGQSPLPPTGWSLRNVICPITSQGRPSLISKAGHSWLVDKGVFERPMTTTTTMKMEKWLMKNYANYLDYRKSSSLSTHFAQKFLTSKIKKLKFLQILSNSFPLQ